MSLPAVTVGLVNFAVFFVYIGTEDTFDGVPISIAVHEKLEFQSVQSAPEMVSVMNRDPFELRTRVSALAPGLPSQYTR